jgi:hypothetical protein
MKRQRSALPCFEQGRAADISPSDGKRGLGCAAEASDLEITLYFWLSVVKMIW